MPKEDAIVHDRPALRRARLATRIALGGALVFAGVSHLTFARQEFRAQVPPWLPIDEEVVVVASGVVEIDAKRLGRLPFQAVLIAGALWSTAAWRDRRAILGKVDPRT